MHEDGRRWNERYAASPTPSPRAPEAVDLWPELASELPVSGRCLDIASGTGAVTLWLAQRGLDVIALDVSDVAIGRLEAAATASGLSGRRRCPRGRPRRRTSRGPRRPRSDRVSTLPRSRALPADRRPTPRPAVSPWCRCCRASESTTPDRSTQRPENCRARSEPTTAARSSASPRATVSPTSWCGDAEHLAREVQEPASNTSRSASWRVDAGLVLSTKSTSRLANVSGCSTWGK